VDDKEKMILRYLYKIKDKSPVERRQIYFSIGDNGRSSKDLYSLVKNGYVKYTDISFHASTKKYRHYNITKKGIEFIENTLKMPIVLKVSDFIIKVKKDKYMVSDIKRRTKDFPNYFSEYFAKGKKYNYRFKTKKIDEKHYGINHIYANSVDDFKKIFRDIYGR